MHTAMHDNTLKYDIFFPIHNVILELLRKPTPGLGVCRKVCHYAAVES